MSPARYLATAYLAKVFAICGEVSESGFPVFTYRFLNTKRSYAMCNMKTMLKVMLGIGLLAAMAYVALPQHQTAIASVTPLLLALACPVAMLLMAIGMTGNNESRAADGGRNEQACGGRQQTPSKPITQGEHHA